jgi:hypothetical protein
MINEKVNRINESKEITCVENVNVVGTKDSLLYIQDNPQSENPHDRAKYI